MTNVFMEELHLFIASLVTDDQQHNVPYFVKRRSYIIPFFSSRPCRDA